MMTIGYDDYIWTIIYTMIYTIISMNISFRLTELLNDEDGGVEKLTRHFILWPIEILFIVIIAIKCSIKDKHKKRR